MLYGVPFIQEVAGDGGLSAVFLYICGHMAKDFTRDLQKVFSYAREEAARLGNREATIDHIFLGLLRDGDNDATAALDALGANRPMVRAEIESVLKEAQSVPYEEAANIQFSRDIDDFYRNISLEIASLKTFSPTLEVVLLAVLKAILSEPLYRALHRSDMEEERDMTGKVVVAETLASAQQVYVELGDILKSRKTRNHYFPRQGTVRLADFSGSVPLEYRRGKNAFVANFVFQRMERTGTRIYLEIIRWEKKNGVIGRSCLQAMRGLDSMLRDAVLDIDSAAVFREYDR